MGHNSHTKSYILKLAMSNSRKHCSFVFSTPNRQKIFQRGYKWSLHEALYLINLVWKNLFSLAKYSKYDTN